ncbi:pseudaminic acid synthase [Endothiovibrio diazotrophicus]
MVIAEMSGNHNRSLDRALAIVDAAANSGAHAVKLQTYTPETMTLDLDRGEFFIDDPANPWAGQSLYKLYGEANTPWEWHGAIFERCRERGLLCFSSPFDETAIDFLESLDAPAYKIASFENTDLPLIRRAAATGKPLILSTGMATPAELTEAVEAARGAGCTELILLKCTSSYPAPAENCNLATIPHLRELFGCQVGLSDHTLGIGVAVAATALGATVIEKHFTLRRADGGVDAAFSMEPAELKQLVEETARAARALGTVHYGPVGAEDASLQHRRSLYIAEDLKAGEILTEKNLRRIRPGLGLAPKHYETVLGMAVSRDVATGTPLSWELLKPA